MAIEPNPSPLNKDKEAVALTYNMEKDEAPRVTAKGKGYINKAG